MLLKRRTLLFKNVYSLVLTLKRSLQLSNQSLFEFIQLVKLVLVGSFLLVVRALDCRVGSLNRIHVTVAVVFPLKFRLLSLRVHTGRVGLFVREISVAEFCDGVVVRARVGTGVRTTVMILRCHTSPLIFNSGRNLILAEVVEFILTLPFVFKVVQPVLATFVVRASAVLNICREV